MPHTLVRRPSQPPAWLLPAALLCLTLAIRLWNIDLTRFSDDEVSSYRAALAVLDTHDFGPPADFTFGYALGARLPPLFAYILAAFACVRRDPVFVSACAASLNALAAPFAYGAARRITNSSFAGAAAGVMYAVLPAAIWYGRMIPNTELLPFFSAVALWGLVRVWCDGWPWALGVSLLACGWAVQLHLVAAPLALLWVGVAAAKWRSPRPAPLLVAGALVCLTLAPYLAAEVRSGWPDIPLFAEFLHRPQQADLNSLRTAGSTTGSAVFRHHLLDMDGDGQYDLETWLMIGLTLAGAAIGARRLQGGGGIVLGWVALPILFSIRHTFEVGPHYLLTILPGVAVLQGLAIEGIASLPWAKAGSAVKPLPAAALGVLAAVQLGSYEHFLRGAELRGNHAPYVVPLRYSIEAAEMARPFVGNQPVYLDVPDPEKTVVPYLSGTPERWRWVGFSWPLLVVPSGTPWYLAQHDSPERTLLHASFQPIASVTTPEGDSEFELFRLPAGAAFLDQLHFQRLNADMGPSISVQGFLSSRLTAGQASPVNFAWRVNDGFTLARLRMSEFAHLVDAQGRIWSQAADVWNLTGFWKNGDLVISPLQLDIRSDAPTGGYWLETGFYETFSRRPLGSPVRVGPLRVAGAPPATAAGEPRALLGEEEIELLGASWSGDRVSVRWRARRHPAGDYTVFVHALDGAGKVVAQHDGQPRDGSFPTSLWEAGDVVDDTHPMHLAASDGLRLEIGLYTRPDLKRLAVRASRQPVADRLLLDASKLDTPWL